MSDRPIPMDDLSILGDYINPIADLIVRRELPRDRIVNEVSEAILTAYRLGMAHGGAETSAEILERVDLLFSKGLSNG
jgi:hypothetical protein